MGLEVVATTIREANALVGRWHCHCRPVQGGLWAVAVALDGRVVGAAIVGRPPRMIQDGRTCTILRVATDGTRNANSMLYGACRRAARDLGYKRVRTQNLKSESGSSLRAAGFMPVREIPAGKNWNRPSRPRITHDLFGEPTTPQEEKITWECLL